MSWQKSNQRRIIIYSHSEKEWASNVWRRLIIFHGDAGGGGKTKGRSVALAGCGRDFLVYFFMFLITERENHVERRVDFALFCFMLKKKIIDWLRKRGGRSVFTSGSWAIKHFSFDICGTETILRRLSLRKLKRHITFWIFMCLEYLIKSDTSELTSTKTE